ncbi:branched-chain amino acid ABC transporter permease [Nocardioides sp. MAH-18]|uniref:Branched-chain amino acid ABC transporter permease n=1 Tax=Nocardioides agri TaxID=2682843 RepID=A0A6L6XNJ4_9ACTN|nr:MULTISPECIES: branched-chain amino acid ABC transporter permease [unclassified Nocardioides]MBA2953805.1 branched-chain amino acid ABC transporter permease [Nocardioides sp. CGMCC 1.13656]MVQ48670.1 branched-chain amino acid ABC transporter permease [Nocardioides sp. MAH-18]
MTATVSTPETTAEVAPGFRRPSQRRRGPWAVAAWVVLMLAVPLLVSSDQWMGVGIFALIAAVGVLGIQIVMGLAGQVSIATAAFMPIGAYTAAWLGVDHGQPFWVWLPASAVVAGIGGALFAPIAVRMRGHYLGVATLGLVFIASYVWEVWTDLTGGSGGRVAAPVVINGQDLLDGYWSGDTQVLTLFQAWWYFAFAVLLVAMVVTWNIKRSRLGRAFMAVRDKDLAAGVVGIPVTRTKTTAFAISSAFAGVSGSLLAAYMGYVTPAQWSLTLSIDFIAMAVIGGAGTIAGALLGALFYKAMPEAVNWLSTYVPFVSQDAKVDGGLTAPLLSQMLFGAAILLVLLFEPRGLNALVRRPFHWARTRRERSAR